MKTRGEQVFEEYLGSLQLPSEYEPPLAARRPDFLVHSPVGDIVCEVKDFELTDEDRAELQAAAADENTFRGREVPFVRIQRRIRDARQQLRDFKGRYPNLVVLFDASSMMALIDMTVLGAMYGEVRLRVPIDMTGTGSFESTTVFERDSRYLTRTSNTTISAVAILEYVRPNQRMLDEAASLEHFNDGAGLTTERIKFILDFSERHPEVFDRVPRLQVFRNMFAAVPWPEGALSGPHDLSWPSMETPPA